jgi:hypothetical protein
MKSSVTRLLVILCITLPAQCFSQWAINKSRAVIKKQLEKQIAQNDTLHILLHDADTALHYSIRDPKVLPADFIYTFDEKGKCNLEKVIANCDSCFNKFLQSALRKKGYQWKKLNNRLYISGFSQKRLLEIPANNTEHSYTIRRMNWTRQAYQTLLTSK